MNKQELWVRLNSYNFDHIVPTNLWEHIAANFSAPNSFSKAFASKIARKHGWKIDFAFRAVKEYKKFVYLGIVSDFQVTPSKVIDVVWHEHLLFSKAYREFCNDVIEYEFDHYPELTPVLDQTARFNAQYFDTLDLYKAEFGVDPPADIWEITKYQLETIPAGNYYSKKKETNSVATTYPTDAPLFTYFDGSGNTGDPGYGGGDFGGAGADGNWNDATNGDSGSLDSGADGSSCSSGCGGGD